MFHVVLLCASTPRRLTAKQKEALREIMDEEDLSVLEKVIAMRGGQGLSSGEAQLRFDEYDAILGLYEKSYVEDDIMCMFISVPRLLQAYALLHHKEALHKVKMEENVIEEDVDV